VGVLQGEIEFAEAMAGVARMAHQRDFLEAPERHAAFVGGQGSGKSVALCLCAIMHGAADPGGVSLIGRLNMSALEKTTMRTFLELVPESWGQWQPTRRIYELENGHQFVFSHLDITDPAVSGHIKSMNLSAAYLDEACEVSEQIYYLLDGRVRRPQHPHQSAAVERFEQEKIRAGFKRARHRVRSVLSADHDDGRAPVHPGGARHFGQLQPVRRRHVQLQEQRVVFFLPQEFRSPAAARFRHCLQVRGHHDGLDGIAGRFVGVHNQHAESHSFIHFG